MRMVARFLLAIALSTCSCGGTSDETVTAPKDAATDGTVADTAGLDVSSDGPAPDGADTGGAPDTGGPPLDTGSGGDSTGTDTGGGDASTCGPSTTCYAYICTCGRCDPAKITCLNVKKDCPLDCVSECPELATTKCDCVGGSCTKVP